MVRIKGNREELIRAIDNNIIGYKSIRNRAMLKDHFIDGMTYEEVAEKYSISARQVKQIAHDNMKYIRDYLE